MSTLDTVFAFEVELEYVETEAGDVYALALVSASGDILSITDVDTGADIQDAIEPAEMLRVWDRIRAAQEDRRAAA